MWMKLTKGDLIMKKNVATKITNDIKIAYFQVPGKDRYVCVAIRRPAKDAIDTTYTAAYSFYSKAHESRPFLKSQAREIALKRLERGTWSSTFSLSVDEDTSLKSVFDEALNRANFISVDDAYGTQYLAPCWFTRALDKNQLVFGLTHQK